MVSCILCNLFLLIYVLRSCVVSSGGSITDADIVMVCIRLYLFKSWRRAVAAVCPESLPRARRWYLEGLCLRLFVCAGVGGRGTEHGLHGSDGYAWIMLLFFPSFLPCEQHLQVLFFYYCP